MQKFRSIDQGPKDVFKSRDAIARFAGVVETAGYLVLFGLPCQAAEVPAAAVRRFGLLSPGMATALGVLVLVLAIATLTLRVSIIS